MTQKSAFALALPDAYYLDPSDPVGLTGFLRDQGWLATDDAVRDVSPAGEGNMNCAVRVTTATASFILKQSRPWVEKYPHIEAPPERVLREGEFYELVETRGTVAGMMPRLLGFSRKSLMLKLEDLGPAADYTWMYRGSAIAEQDLDHLVGYLSALHAGFTEFERKGAFSNRAMRQLNHEHIFHIPLVPNDLDLDSITEGLQSAADELKGRYAVRHRSSAAGGALPRPGARVAAWGLFPRELGQGQRCGEGHRPGVLLLWST